MNRAARKRIGEQTVEICNKGFYNNSLNQRVSLTESLQRSLAGAVVYGAKPIPGLDDAPPAAQAGAPPTVLEVTTESTLDAARRLWGYLQPPSAAGRPPPAAPQGIKLRADERGAFCLNFASAKNPGGGFLGGSVAQEESIARCSTLYYCQTHPPASELYTLVKSLPVGEAAWPHTLYTHGMSYVPAVGVFREEHGEGALLDAPYPAAVLSAPAPNMGATLQNYGPASKRKVPKERLEALVLECLQYRIRRILAVAHQQGHEALVLGAYGCGVFRNDPRVVATVFRDLLNGEFRHVFRLVVFAVYARDETDKTFLAFKRLLSPVAE